MAIDELKKELVAYIQNINDEELLSLLKEDLIFYQKTSKTDITDKLSESQIEELRKLSEEDETKDIMGLEQFRQATQKWRIK